MRKIFLVALLLWVPALAQPDFSTPEAAYKTYLAACQAGSFEQADLCYTASSREELKAMQDGLERLRQLGIEAIED